MSGPAAPEHHSPAPQPSEELLAQILQRPVTVAVALAGTRARLGDLGRLRQGEILNLSESAEAPMELQVHGRTVGRGQPVTVGGKLGLRLADMTELRRVIESLGRPPSA